MPFIIRAQIYFLAGLMVSFLITTVVKTESPLNSNRFLKINTNENSYKEPDAQLGLNTSQVVITKQPRNTTNTATPREFLIAHNKVRVKFGEPPLQWDKNLAHYARRWASKRIIDCKMIHSYGPYGENIFWGGRDHWTPTDVVRSWVDEYQYYHTETNDCEPQQMCGHYTQIVWRDTTRIGCARVKCNNGGLFVMCSYDPPGNYVNESPFGGSNSTPNMPSSPPSSSGVQSGSSSQAPPASTNTNTNTATVSVSA